MRKKLIAPGTVLLKDENLLKIRRRPMAYGRQKLLQQHHVTINRLSP